jgi:hypothetical protein
MGAQDKLPGWANELKVREILWTKYGIPFDDAEIRDIQRAVRLANAEATRKVKNG